jgi:hypothetical protein
MKQMIALGKSEDETIKAEEQSNTLYLEPVVPTSRPLRSGIRSGEHVQSSTFPLVAMTEECLAFAHAHAFSLVDYAC